MIAAIILAAGESRRMKEPKMLLPFRGKTMIETVVDNMLVSDISKVIVVVGAGRENIVRVLEKYPVKTVVNEDYQQGMLSSVRRGINSLPEDCTAAIVIPGDMPVISPEVVKSVVETYKKTGKRIVIPVFNGKRGHPLLVDSSLFAGINRLEPGIGLRQLAELNPGDVQEAKVDSDSILKDIDTRDEYYKEINSN